ncbi:MAG: EAL domain-containing protein [Methyloprofundus sp.]|nr:EAL domain-containing protein [Methyloprofundus sp.]
MLSRAIENDVYLVYQPIFDTHGRVAKHEALLRLNPQAGVNLSTQALIDRIEQDAEDIAYLDRMVLSRVEVLLKSTNFKNTGRIAVNASPATLATSEVFIQDLIALCQRFPDRIELEMLESRIQPQHEQLVHLSLLRLEHANVQLSLDDFGAGFACIRKLVTHGFDNIKLDGQLTRVHVCDKSARAVRSIVDMAESLGITVTAERIESKRQHHQLMDLGCHYFQGYYLSKPVLLECGRTPNSVD